MARREGADAWSRCRAVLLLAVIQVLQACGGTDVPQIPPQHWQDLEIVVETRPVQVRSGMTEFLVIATDERGLPGHEMVVSLRMTAAEPWSQAIQDGHSGVFRRAVRVEAGQLTVQVQLRRGESVTVLEFPLPLAGDS